MNEHSLFKTWNHSLLTTQDIDKFVVPFESNLSFLAMWLSSCFHVLCRSNIRLLCLLILATQPLVLHSCRYAIVQLYILNGQDNNIILCWWCLVLICHLMSPPLRLQVKMSFSSYNLVHLNALHYGPLWSPILLECFDIQGSHIRNKDLKNIVYLQQ